MTPDALNALTESFWLAVVVPAVLLAGITLTVRLRLPQVLRLRAAWRALGDEDQGVSGAVPPAASVALSLAAQQGAAAAVGAATAIGLGGPGALPWVWMLAFLLAPLRLGETLLARTAPPGRASRGVPGSLAARLAHDGGWRSVGRALAVLLAFAAPLIGAGLHGVAAAEATAGVLPDAPPFVVAGGAVVALGLALAPPVRVAVPSGYAVLVALVLVTGVGVLAALSDPGGVLPALARAISDVFAGAEETGAWTGALAGEIARAGVVSASAPLVAAGGSTGAFDALARARSTRGQAAAALLGPLAYALVVTAVGVATTATGTFFKRVPGSRTLDQVVVLSTAYETASQRREPDRYRNGFLRIREGRLRDVSLTLATERGTIDGPRFSYYGRPADLAAETREGRVVRLMRNQGLALKEIPARQAARVVVEGELLPTRGHLLAVTAARAPGGKVAAQAMLAGLAVLAALGAGALGLSVRRTLEETFGRIAGRVAGALPGAGMLALVAVREQPAAAYLEPLAGLVAGVIGLTVSLVLLVRSGEIARLDR
jgi:AGCS family alanine or glycine:cation symporter